MALIKVTANDRLERKHHVECDTEITIGELKELIAETSESKVHHSNIHLKKWYTTYKDHITLSDYEIEDGMVFEMY